MDLSPAFIAALVARNHGQVILTREEYYVAGLLTITAEAYGKDEILLRTVQDGQRSGCEPDGE